MGDKVATTQKQKNQLLEEAKRDIYGLINSTDKDMLLRSYNSIKEKRMKNKEYNGAYQEAWKELSKNKKYVDLFSKKWNEAEEMYKTQTTATQNLIETLRKVFPNAKSIEISISGTGIATQNEKQSTFDAYLKVTDKNENAIWGGIKFRRDDDYGVSYEYLGKKEKTKEGIKEMELWIKDGISKLNKWKDAKTRFAQFREYWIEPNENAYIFLSGETGTYSYTKFKKESDNSITLIISGSASTSNVTYEKMKKEKVFYQYRFMESNIPVVNKINDKINEINTGIIQNFNTGKRDFTLTIKPLDRKTTIESYKGGKVKIGDNYFALSAPFIEKNPDMSNPRMYVFVYYLDKDGNQIKAEKIEVEREVSLSFLDTYFNLKVSPSKESIDEAISSLYNQTYYVIINETKLPINPSINKTVNYQDNKSNYKIEFNSVNFSGPVINGELQNMTADLNITDNETGTTQKLKLNIGIQTSIKLGNNILDVKIEQPDYITVLNNVRYENMRINVMTNKVENDKKEIAYLNNVSWDGIVALNEKEKINLQAKAIMFSEGPFAEKEEKLKEKIPKSRKQQEILTEETAQMGAIGTLTGLSVQNMIGVSFNAINSIGNGVWGIFYDPRPLIEKGYAGSGDALKQITAKFKTVGWKSLGLTGLTAYEQEQLSKGNSNIEKIRDVTGYGLWLLLDTFALHGEGRIVDEKIKKEIINMIETKGDRREVLFSTFDPNREGFQILTINYNQERKKGEQNKNYINIQKTDYNNSTQYKINNMNGLINSLYGKLDLYGVKRIQDEIMVGNPTNIKQLTEFSYKKWNPIIGIGTPVGAYEVGLHYANGTEIKNIESSELKTDITEIKERGQNLIAKGIPLFGMEINGTYEKRKMDNLTKNNGILTLFSTNNYEIVEIQPLAKLGLDAYAYLTVRQTLDSSVINSLEKKEVSKTKSISREIRPGVKNKWIELNIFYILNDQETFKKTISNLERMKSEQKQWGINTFGKASENLTFNLSYYRTWNSLIGTTWGINARVALRFDLTKK